MENKFKYSNDNKRYHTWNYHLHNMFGQKVFKVALNGGFTCPNIDGSKGKGGCIYCSDGSGDFAGNPAHSILKQFEEIKERMHKKWTEAQYIPYFQEVEVLQGLPMSFSLHDHLQKASQSIKRIWLSPILIQWHQILLKP